MEKQLKIALITPFNPFDRRAWSGSLYYMVKALRNNVGNVEYIGPKTARFAIIKERLDRLLIKIFGKNYQPETRIMSPKWLLRKVEAKLAGSNYDFIFAPVASSEIALLKTSLPIVSLSDATFRLLYKTYQQYFSLSEKRILKETRLELMAMQKSIILLYPSDWAAQSAIADYGISEDKIRIIPFGANIDHAPPRESVVNKQIDGRVKMLFLSKNWERKGGPVAVDTLNALLKRGIDSELVILGVNPPNSFRHPNIKLIPYIDKNIAEERDRFEQILIDSHLLLLPTNAECFGIVFCEANAYGLPVFSRSVGGIPSVVKNGENGYLLPPDATGEDFASLIEKTVREKAVYSALNRGARDRYDKLLNWDTWALTLKAKLNTLLK